MNFVILFVYIYFYFLFSSEFSTFRKLFIIIEIHHSTHSIHEKKLSTNNGRKHIKVDKTYIGSLVQTHLSWDATSQSQSSLRSKSELVTLSYSRSRWCFRKRRRTVLMSNTSCIDTNCIESERASER